MTSTEMWPDLGDAYRQAGVTSSTELFFYTAEIRIISIIRKKELCASVGNDFEGRPHMATFDFNLDQFKLLIRGLCDVEQAKEIIAEYQRTRPPNYLTLPAPIIVPAIRCRIGRPVRGARESFVPFIVKEFHTKLGADPRCQSPTRA